MKGRERLEGSISAAGDVVRCGSGWEGSRELVRDGVGESVADAAHGLEMPGHGAELVAQSADMGIDCTP